MTRTLYDSVAASDIPPGSELVAGYLDGTHAWSASDWAMFPGKVLVRVAIFNNRYDAQVLDLEPGNNDAQGSVPWISGKWARGETPTIYCNTDSGPSGYRVSDVKSACDAAGVAHPLFWVAKYDNIPVIPDGCIGKQYANPTFTGGHYDASVVADYWAGVDAMPEYVTKQEFLDYQKDVRDTINAMKSAYDPLVAHTHDTTTIIIAPTTTGGPK